MNILERVAEIYGVSVDTVKGEIKSALEEGYRNPDPQVRNMWDKLFAQGTLPTAEEAVCILSKYIIESA